MTLRTIWREHEIFLEALYKIDLKIPVFARIKRILKAGVFCWDFKLLLLRNFFDFMIL